MWFGVIGGFLGILSSALLLRAEAIAGRTIESRETVDSLEGLLTSKPADNGAKALADARALFSADARRDRVIASRYRRAGAIFLLAAFVLLLVQSLLAFTAPA